MGLNPGNLLKYFLLYSLEINLLYIYFFRLQQFIVNQEWNDPKSKLQQCCLTLRTMDGGEPDIPVYKVKIRNRLLTLCIKGRKRNQKSKNFQDFLLLLFIYF